MTTVTVAAPRHSAPVRFLRRAVRALLYHLYVRKALCRTDRVSMFGFSVAVFPSVFHPKFYLSTRFLGEYLQARDLEGKEVLEIGSGSGILSLIAADRGARVTAVDINPSAVECTARNARTNSLEKRVCTFQSDLFDAIAPGITFDYVVWNPPFFPKEPEDAAGYAWHAGRGYSAIRRFAEEARSRLREDGRILILLSSDTETDAIISLFESCGFRAVTVRKARRLFEVLSIHELFLQPWPDEGKKFE